MRPQYIKPSPYFKFHFLFLGYCFQEKKTGRIYKKWQVWNHFKAASEYMLHNEKLSPLFQLVDSEGWHNGELIEEPNMQLGN